MSNIQKSEPIGLLALYAKDRNPTSIIAFQRKLTLDSAITTQNYFYKHLDKDTEPLTIEVIKELVVNLQDILILNNKMTEMQCYEVANLIFEKHSTTITLEELALLFKQVKMGDYGKVFHSINITIIFDWIDQYLNSEERAGFWERKNRSKQNNLVKLEEVIPDEALETIKAEIGKVPVKKALQVGGYKKQTSFGLKGLGLKQIINENKDKLKKQ